MEQITIQIKNKQKAQAVINFLKSLDFIDEVTTKNMFSQVDTKNKDEEFFALAGLWAGRDDLTLDSIRIWR